MLTHNAIRERLRFINEDGAQENWSYYRGHLGSCVISKWANHGYSGVKCNCGHDDKLSADKPTLAAIDVAFEMGTRNAGSFEETFRRLTVTARVGGQ